MATRAEKEAVLDFAKYCDQRVRVRFQGGREVDGVLKGYDKLDNLVLEDSIEYLRDPNDPTQVTDKTRKLGLVVCRGTQVSLICPSDEMEEIANPFAEEEEEVEGEAEADA
uniref:Sm domain-containing protein n=1 Tax=Spumella elongata TaxID=89044 RepID=A0A7S3HHZ6_9STRA|eukprot:CAMPEP_0184993328 /NCGR_PEP_ID=MMETSP1098-20130426/45150_1 /TAXON_ID=89044 /ORGANISM="Spumella elongata, Strain CCAP 955/1" /LENGTH=110 /DNA_ID=CAMNT_0027519145 /DNA_START=27 /DNA_END=359 /DNA_ORIENTATION=-